MNAKIGISTTNPLNKLHVVASSDPLRLEGLQTSANTRVLVVDANGVVSTNPGVGAGAFLWSHNGTITWLTNTSDSIGIGTTNPAANLHLYESVPGRTLEQLNESNDGVSVLTIKGTSDNSKYFGYGAGIRFAENGTPGFGTIYGSGHGIYFDADNSETYVNLVSNNEAINATQHRNFEIGDHENRGALIGNFSTNTVVDGAFKMGIMIFSSGEFTGGSGGPTRNMGIFLDEVSGADENWSIYSNGGNSFFRDYVGIGVNNEFPTNVLHVKGTNPLRLEGLQSGSGSNILVADANGVIQLNSAIGSNAMIWSRSGATSYLTNVNDKVGIGTTTPSESLDVAGNIKSSGSMTAITLNASQLIHLTPVSSAPVSPVEGDLYMDATTHKLRVFDGTTWQDCW